MNFASAPFVLLFLPIVLGLFHALRGPRAAERRMALLIVASMVFYLAGGWRNGAILAGSILGNFLFGTALITLPRERPGRRKAVMWAAVLANLGVLLTFKLRILDASGGAGFSAAEDVLLPLALSFVTFQQIGFIVGCHRGTIRRLSVGRYLFFVLFFPQLVLGPIVRFEDIDRQLDDGALARTDSEWLATGLAVFSLALAKKLLLANTLAVPVDAVFARVATGEIAWAEAWFAIVTFQFQLFLDFSAYAEMAIGLAMMVGMKVPLNFDRPLFARDRADMWRRWHISFATFMRGNVFLPLVRHWRWPAWAALAATGILSGLWHGLGPTFVIWGIAQTTILLVLHWRTGRQRRGAEKRLPVPAAIATTFLTTCLLGVLFRSPDIAALGRVVEALAGGGGTAAAGLVGPREIVGSVLAAVLIWAGPDLGQIFRGRWRFTELRPGAKPPPVHPLERWIGFAPTLAWGIVIAALMLAALLALVAQGSASRFVYVQF